ncbi:MAG TPA: hypothetical protein VJT31_15780 [Rugosimonospora sp.]|nr:hypothetical protein [Rugosimonospora sp.]
MGTSYTEYGSLGFWARDETVELWLYLLVGVVDEQPEPMAWLRDAREDWYAQATVGFQGFVSAGLDEHLVREPGRESAFLGLVAIVHDRLASYGEAIPSSATTRWSIGGGKDLGEVSTDLMHRFTAAVVGLVHGQATWDTTARVPGVWAPP